MTPREQWRDFVEGVRWRRSRQGSAVGDEPHFDPAGRQLFDAALAQAGVYLEYGTGGSTVLASKTVETVCCAETDADYLDAVRRAVGTAPARVIFCHCDIGVTEQWGAPLVKLRTDKQRALWARYPWTPWEALGSQVADLVMIDGRFRVASAAVSMIRAPEASLLFDDYLDRPFYWAVDAIGDRVAQAGRMVQFRRRATASDEDLLRLADAFAADWR